MTIVVTYTRRSDDDACTPSLVPFKETVPLDVKGAVISLTLAEDH